MSRVPLLVALGACGGLLIGCSAKPEQPPTVTAAKSGGSQPRRSVKTATDPDSGKINPSPSDTTVENIVAQKPPANLTGRSGPFETTTWRVKATLKSVQLMKDGDYYLVMKGDKGGQTVVEVPDPAQCKGSPLQPEIAAARKALEERYHPTSTVQKLDQPAVVSGVGFLGWGNTGKNKNSGGRTGARLMPGTGFDFGGGR